MGSVSPVLLERGLVDEFSSSVESVVGGPSVDEVCIDVHFTREVSGRCRMTLKLSLYPMPVTHLWFLPRSGQEN